MYVCNENWMNEGREKMHIDGPSRTRLEAVENEWWNTGMNIGERFALKN